MISVHSVVLGPLRTNCYVVYGGGEAVVVDPGWPYGVEAVAAILREEGLKAKAVIATHGHFDHVLGYWSLAEALGYEPPFYINGKDAPMLGEASRMAETLFGVRYEEWRPPSYIDASEGLEVSVGGEKLVVIETPGHTRGSITLVGGGYAFTGDTLFRGTVGRTDLPGGSWRSMIESLRRLASLPPDTRVMPGHGPPTTIGVEVRANQYVKAALRAMR